MTKYASTSQQLVINVGAGKEASKETDWASLAPAFLAAVLVISGWLVVERFARLKERRSDLRELAKLFSLAVDDIVNSAHEFYRLDGVHNRALTLATLIRTKLAGLPRLLEAMDGIGASVNVNDQLRQFRQAVTGGEFDQRSRTASQIDDGLFPLITSAGRSLADEVQVSLFNWLSKASRKRFVLVTKPIK